MTINDVENRNCCWQHKEEHCNFYNANESNDHSEKIMNCDTQEELLREIKSLQFAIIELGLYLDTHPEDERALCLHRKYAKELRDVKEKYQKVYGPLTINFPCNKWRWLEEPWASLIFI